MADEYNLRWQRYLVSRGVCEIRGLGERAHKRVPNPALARVHVPPLAAKSSARKS